MALIENVHFRKSMVTIKFQSSWQKSPQQFDTRVYQEFEQPIITNETAWRKSPGRKGALGLRAFGEGRAQGGWISLYLTASLDYTNQVSSTPPPPQLPTRWAYCMREELQQATTENSTYDISFVKTIELVTFPAYPRWSLLKLDALRASKQTVVKELIRREWIYNYLHNLYLSFSRFPGISGLYFLFFGDATSDFFCDNSRAPRLISDETREDWKTIEI